MSKSDENQSNYIALLDTPDVIQKKINRAVTDSGKEIRFDLSKPGISNLMIIYASITDRSMDSLQFQYADRGYSDFKKDLTEIIIEFLNPVQKRYRSISSDPGELISLLKNGAAEARTRAQLPPEVRPQPGGRGAGRSDLSGAGRVRQHDARDHAAGRTRSWSTSRMKIPESVPRFSTRWARLGPRPKKRP